MDPRAKTSGNVLELTRHQTATAIMTLLGPGQFRTGADLPHPAAETLLATPNCANRLLASLKTVLPSAPTSSDSHSLQTATCLKKRRGTLFFWAQKVGEEGVEVALAAVPAIGNNSTTKPPTCSTHLLVCLRAAGSNLDPGPGRPQHPPPLKKRKPLGAKPAEASKENQFSKKLSSFFPFLLLAT